MPAPTSAQLKTLWQTLQTRDGSGSPITLLHLGEQQTQLICPGADTAPVMITVPIGTTTLHTRYFLPRPTPAGLETAIMVVEDALAPIHSQLLVAGLLYCADPCLLQISQAAGLPATSAAIQPLTGDAVEQLFQRYCQFVEGGAPLRLDWSETGPAALLVLHEWLHHLVFRDVYVLKEITE